METGRGYAGFWVRFAAIVIDWIILGVAGAILAAISTRAYFYGTMGWLLVAAYFIAFWTWKGQTPGKMALDLKVIKADGGPVDLATAILRYIGYLVSGLILGIGFLLIPFDSRKQGLHDKIAGTFVIRAR